jgi:hypothetical protein
MIKVIRVNNKMASFRNSSRSASDAFQLLYFPAAGGALWDRSHAPLYQPIAVAAPPHGSKKFPRSTMGYALND